VPYENAWRNRGSPENRLPHIFSPSVHGEQYFRFNGYKGSVDTKPIYIERPQKFQEYFYSGKYSHHVLKILLLTDNRGVPMRLYGPFMGVNNDTLIFRKNVKAGELFCLCCLTVIFLQMNLERLSFLEILASIPRKILSHVW